MEDAVRCKSIIKNTLDDSPKPKRKRLTFSEAPPDVHQFEKIQGERGCLVSDLLLKARYGGAAGQVPWLINQFLDDHDEANDDTKKEPDMNLFSKEENTESQNEWDWEDASENIESLAQDARKAKHLGHGFTIKDLNTDIDISECQIDTSEEGMMPFNLSDVYEDGNVDAEGNFTFHERETEETKLNKDPWIMETGSLTQKEIEQTAAAHEKQQEQLRKAKENRVDNTSLGSLIILLEIQNIVQEEYLDKIVDFRKMRTREVIRPLIRDEESVSGAMRRIKKEDQGTEPIINSKAKGKGKLTSKQNRLSPTSQNTMDLIIELATDGLELVDSIYTLNRRDLLDHVMKLIPEEHRTDIVKIPLPQQTETPESDDNDASPNEFSASEFSASAFSVDIQ